MTLPFTLTMAWRDSRRARRRLLLFSFSVVLGIAALVAIGSFTANLRQAIEDQARTLLGADFSVGSREPLPPALQSALDALHAQQAREVSFASMAVFPSSQDQTRLVSARAVEGAYPFYGDMVTIPASAAGALRAPGSDAALVEESLATQYGLKVGDPIKLGQTTFRYAGALHKMPGESAAVAMLSPRIYFPLARLADTGLAAPGSLLRHRTYLKLDPSQSAVEIVAALREKYGSLRLNFETVEDRKRELGEGLKNVYAFLSLIGFVSLFLGGIGVASAVAVYIRDKVSTVAILRCLGASARQAFSVYLVQGVALGLAGALAGAALGIGVQLLVPLVVRDFLPFEVSFFVSWASVAQGMIAGLVICVVFCLLPLLAIRRVSPLLALRSAFIAPARGRDWAIGSLYAVLVLCVLGFAVWQTRSWRVGGAFAGGLFVTLAILAGVARALAWSARRMAPRKLPYVWRQGIANLHRPNNRTVLLLVSLGLGTFLLVVLALSRETLLAQIGSRGGADRPNLLFFDIQEDQIAPLARQMSDDNAPLLAQAPIVTMRLSTWKGRPVQQVIDDPALKIPTWTLKREYRSTFRDHLTDTEKVSAGDFTTRVAADVSPVPISVEEGLARDMQLKLGDELVWDVQGVPLATRITSLRTVDWQRLQPNFFVVFPAGVLEPAPKTYVAATRGATPEASARLQQHVVQRFPNVSAIDLAVILQTLDNIFAKVEFVVRFMALFTLATGFIVLIGAVMTGRYQRVRESVLLRTLGASRNQLLSIQMVEYLILGCLAGLAGGGLAYAGNSLLARFVFHVPVVAPPQILFWSWLGVTLLTLATGLVAHRGVTRVPPLEVLRQET